MGTGDQSDPTTDFFDTHRAQCVEYASKLRKVVGAEALVAAYDASVSLCDTAIANGRGRVDMPVAVTPMPQLVAKYQALPAKVRSDLAAALVADEVVPVDAQSVAVSAEVNP